MGFAGRAGQWGGLAGGVPAHLRNGRDGAVRLAMVEETEAVENLDAILATAGIDAIFIGPGDLSLSMGVPGGDERVVATTYRAAGFGACPGDRKLRVRVRRGVGCRGGSADPADLRRVGRGGTLIDTSDNYNRGQSEDFAGALGLELTDDHFDRIDRASAVTLGVPHDGAVANRRRLLGGPRAVRPVGGTTELINSACSGACGPGQPAWTQPT